MFRLTNRFVFAPDDGGGGGGGASAGATAAPDAGAAAPPPAPSAPPVFAETLPEDIRGDAAFRDIKDLDGLARGYVGQAKLIGIPRDRLLALPADPADDAAMAPVYDRLGRPEKADAYQFKTDALPEGVTIDEPTVGWFRDTAHKLGLSQRQAGALFEAWNAHAGGVLKTARDGDAASHEQAIGALRGEWGDAFDDKLALAKQALGHYGGAKAEAIAQRYGSDPELARIFAEVGKVLVEAKVIGGGAGTGTAGTRLAPVEAQQEINTLYGDPDFVKRMGSRDPQVRAAANAVLERLFKAAYPEQPQART